VAKAAASGAEGKTVAGEVPAVQEPPGGV